MSPSPVPCSAISARDEGARALCNWRIKRLGAVARAGAGRFGRYWLPADLADEVLDATFVSVAEELTLDRLPSLAPHDIEARATVRAESRAIDALRRVGREPVRVSLDDLESASRGHEREGRQFRVGLLVDSSARLVAECDAVKRAMLSLSPADRRLLSMHAVGLQPGEIGVRLGTGSTAIRKRSERAVKRVRACRSAQEEIR